MEMEDLVNRQGQTMASIEQVLVRIANALEQTTKGGGLST